MRLVRLEEIEGNEKLAKPIIDIDGRILLSKGIQLKLSYLNKLNALGISSVYIEDAISEGIEVNDIIGEDTRLQAQTIVKKEIERFAKNKKIDTSEFQRVAYHIIDDILSKQEILFNLNDIKTKDNYTFAHSVNVCVLAVLLSRKLGIDLDRTQSIAIGCLLHDFGKMLLPDQILNKPGKLTSEEYEEMKKHPLYGYEALKDDVILRPIAKVTILMHHERIDGLGYPHALKKDKIHEAAKICSICDSFDALTSDRIYRKARTVSDAVEYMHSMAGIQYDKEMVNTFLKCVPTYPEGTIVLLNTGVIAIVVKNNVTNVLRPIVRLLYNTKTHIKYSGNHIVDMMEELTLKIEREIDLNINKIT